MNTLFTIAAMVVFAALIKDTILSGWCLLLALAERRNGVTRYNYLRWEMPTNDIENQIEDEIKVNAAFVAGSFLWLLTVVVHSGFLMIPYALYACYVFGNYSDMKDRLGKRYEDFYELFSSINRREDFSDDLVVYGARIEGTLTKLMKCRLTAVLLVMLGLVIIFF